MRIAHAVTMSNERSVSCCMEMLVVPGTLACDAAEIMSSYKDKKIEETEGSMHTAA